MEPRKPTEAEKKELLDYLIESGQADALPDEIDFIDNNLYIAVFDRYITDGPGYAGKVMVVVWSGSPSFTETYIWNRPILPEEKKKPIGQIDWHDGKHEPKLEKVTIEQ